MVCEDGGDDLYGRVEGDGLLIFYFLCGMLCVVGGVLLEDRKGVKETLVFFCV